MTNEKQGQKNQTQQSGMGQGKQQGGGGREREQDEKGGMGKSQPGQKGQTPPGKVQNR